MAEQADGSAPRKRVRTGCLTCRGRRRKCDESKPECSNCKSKKLVCRYGVNITFVQSKFQKHAGPESAENETPSPKHVLQPVATMPQRHPSPDDLFNVGESDHFLHQQSEQPSDAHDYGVRRSLPPPARPPISRAVSGAPYLTPQGNPVAQQEKKPLYSTNTTRDQYETELLTFYRYDVAPVLDLGVGSLFFGIQTVLESSINERVYHAVLALASSRRASMRPSLRHVDEATSISCAHFATQDLDVFQSPNGAHVYPLLIYTDILCAPFDSWAAIQPRIVQIAKQASNNIEGWNLLARLRLSAVLSALDINACTDILPEPVFQVYNKHEPNYQLCHALWLFERSLSYLTRGSQPVEIMMSPVSAWLSRWQEAQDWYTGRSEDMQPVFELNHGDTSDPGTQDRLSFPCIIFSNACAVVANATHHLVAMLLLQDKPRLAKAAAEYNSSTSSLWHAQRVIGIIITAAEAEIWDCFLIAALAYTAQSLSHHKQIRAAAETLERLSSLSGVDLACAVQNLKQKADQH